jgi:hypothetical protein
MVLKRGYIMSKIKKSLGLLLGAGLALLCASQGFGAAVPRSAAEIAQAFIARQSLAQHKSEDLRALRIRIEALEQEQKRASAAHQAAPNIAQAFKQVEAQDHKHERYLLQGLQHRQRADEPAKVLASKAEKKHAAAEAEACSICQDNLIGRKRIAQLEPCLHIFHQECIDPWLASALGNGQCPLCRSAVSPLVDRPAAPALAPLPAAPAVPVAAAPAAVVPDPDPVHQSIKKYAESFARFPQWLAWYMLQHGAQRYPMMGSMATSIKYFDSGAPYSPGILIPIIKSKRDNHPCPDYKELLAAIGKSFYIHSSYCALDYVFNAMHGNPASLKNSAYEMVANTEVRKAAIFYSSLWLAYKIYTLPPETRKKVLYGLAAVGLTGAGLGLAIKKYGAENVWRMVQGYATQGAQWIKGQLVRSFGSGAP